MKKQEMIKYLERYIKIYEQMEKEHEEKYKEKNNFIITRLECYKDILKDFTKGEIK